jgi:polyvinyl alcohol dehydrogenase (cytochrome)
MRLLIIALLAMGAQPSSLAHATESDDWSMYGRDLHHSFTRSQSPVNSSNVASLVPAWTFYPGDAVTANPTVVGGVVYIGSWDGFFYALDANSGAVRWRFQVDCQNAVIPIPPQCLAPGQTPPDRQASDGGLITASATVRDGRVYFSGGKTMYCLRASDGSLVWKKVVCGNPDQSNCEADDNDPTRIFSSPAYFGGKLIFGHTSDGVPGYRGRVVALNAANGNMMWAFEVDPVADANGRPVLDSHGNPVGAYNRGCGSVWSTAAVDEITATAFFGTGDCQNAAPPPYHEALLALDTDSGRIRWAFRPRADDTCDFDFGASPNILDLNGRRYVGIGGKDGTYYVVDSRSGSLLWSNRVVFGGADGGFIGSTAFDGRRIYGGTGYGELGLPNVCQPDNPADQPIQDPSFHALDALTGQETWNFSGNYSFAASTVASDVVFNGWTGFGSAVPAALRAFNANTGALLLELPQGGSVNSSATITGRMIIFGTGNSYDGAGSTIQAYRLP